MKKLVFHISLSVALFCVLTAIFVLRDKREIFAYQVEKSDESSVDIIEGDSYQCIGEPIEILERPETARVGDTVFLTFKGESYTDYDIRVYYPSGRSTGKSFLPRKSDVQGVFGWEISISENTRAGRLRIAVLSEKSYLLTEIEITD